MKASKINNDKKNKSIGGILFKLIIIISVINLCMIAVTFLSINDEKEELYYNEARIICSDKLNEVCNIVKEEGNNFSRWRYPYAVVNNRGEVLYASIELGLPKTVDLNGFIHFDKASYISNKGLIKTTFPIVINDENKGFMVVFINSDNLTNKSLLEKRINIITPFLISFLINTMILIYYKRYSDNNIIRPIIKITESSNDIVKGTFNNYITYESNTEIGELSYAFELMRDELNIHREREEKLKKAQKEMIVAISHDLKTPLTSIKAYVEGIKDGIAETEEERQEYTCIVLKRVEELNKLIDDLLEHSKADLDVLTICKKEVFIKSFLQGIIKEIELHLMTTGIKFIYDYSSLPEGIVNIDEVRLNQVIFNLISNAIKYSKDNPYIEFKAEVRGKELYVYIEDNGQGVLLEDVPYIFEKFYRGDKERNPQIPGSGIGLSICRYIIEKHYGEIFFKSKINGGSIFYFYIPLV